MYVSLIQNNNVSQWLLFRLFITLKDVFISYLSTLLTSLILTPPHLSNQPPPHPLPHFATIVFFFLNAHDHLCIDFMDDGSFLDKLRQLLGGQQTRLQVLHQDLQQTA